MNGPVDHVCGSDDEVYRVVGDKGVYEYVTDGLIDGDIIACPAVFGRFWARVVAAPTGCFAQSLDDHRHIGFLEFNKDDRHCWTCSNTGSRP